MSVLYKRKEFVLNFKKEKPTMYRIQTMKQPLVPFESLLDEVSSSCGVGRAMVKASVEGLLDRMALFMEYGMPVQLGDFGTFRPSFNVKSQSKEDDLGADNVVKRKIVFRPGKRLKTKLSNISLSSYDPKTKPSESEVEQEEVVES